jgi:hypothetical protein
MKKFNQILSTFLCFRVQKAVKRWNIYLNSDFFKLFYSIKQGNNIYKKELFYGKSRNQKIHNGKILSTYIKQSSTALAYDIDNRYRSSQKQFCVKMALCDLEMCDIDQEATFLSKYLLSLAWS